MAWTLLKRGGDYEEYSAMHLEFLVDGDSDIADPDETADSAAPGSLAMTANEIKKWRKDAAGNWAPIVTGGGSGSGFTLSVTLTADGWTDKEQTVAASGVGATSTVFTSPSPDSLTEYANCGVASISQDTDEMTFSCDTVPEHDLTVYIGVIG